MGYVRDIVLSLRQKLLEGMYKYVQDGDRYVVSIDNHQNLMEALTAFCLETGILAAEVSGIGAVNSATLRFLNPATKAYVDRTFEEQMEISSLVGNVSEKDGKPYLHLHVNLGRSDYSVVGGHMLDCHINGACEVFVTRIGCRLGRRFDPETGLNLYEF